MGFGELIAFGVLGAILYFKVPAIKKVVDGFLNINKEENTEEKEDV